jgi:uncharacterized SAM-binding protein YcdF (DUF218 family)
MANNKLPARVLTVGLSVIGGLVVLGQLLNWRRAPAEPADAALVFGTGVGWKARARCATAAQLFHRGLARRRIASGGVLMPGTRTTEAEWFRGELIRQGVPAERILLEPRATNTLENAKFALPLLLEYGCKTVVLVMSDFEGIRAHLTAKRAWRGQGFTIYDCHAPSTGHWNAWTWWLTREGRSLTWYTVPRLFRYRLWRELWVGA